MFLFDTSIFSYALKGHSLAQLYAEELEAALSNLKNTAVNKAFADESRKRCF